MYAVWPLTYMSYNRFSPWERANPLLTVQIYMLN